MQTRGRWCGLKAVSREAHYLGAAFAACVGGASWYVAVRDLSWVGISAAIAATLVGAFFYTLTALRMSAET